MIEQTGSATYSPEDNKLRLYVGRVPREEFLKLRADGWICTPKQREGGGCDFVATWTPSRRDTALEYGGGIIDDEDQPMAERAADRAERFGMYRDKRTDEATGHADRYDAGPTAHGYQSQAKAERSAARHDRIADRAGDAWKKAEYWQRRTAGVISNALYKSRPDVRMGRIKVLEAELRKHHKHIDEHNAKVKAWRVVESEPNPAEQTKMALYVTNRMNIWSDYLHPRAAELADGDRHKTEKTSLYSLLTREANPITGAEACALYFSNHSEQTKDDDWTEHLTLRLAYENQMLEAQGGRAAHVEMIPGGWLGSYQIHKVNKSPATGRVVSVGVMVKTNGRNRWGNADPNAPEFRLEIIETERMKADVYRAPTPEELAEFEKAKKATKAKEKAARKETAIPLINPTDEDANRLQAIWNEKSKAEFQGRIFRQYGNRQTWIDYIEKTWKPSTVCRISQATYSNASKGSHARAETRDMGANCELQSNSYNAKKIEAHCKIRTTWGDGEASGYPARRVIVLTDKPQKPLPASVWEKPFALEPETAKA